MKNTELEIQAKEIDRILDSGIEILPNSPIHLKLKKALSMHIVMPMLLCLIEGKKWTITGGKKYKMLYESKEEYYILNDKGEEDRYWKKHFEVIAQ